MLNELMYLMSLMSWSKLVPKTGTLGGFHDVMQIYLGGSIKGGTPIARWIVYFMENPIEMDDDSGYP